MSQLWLLSINALSVMARVELRKRIGKECPALLKDKELASLQDSILRGLSASKQARRDD